MNLNKEFDESLTDKEYGKRLKECITNADMTQKQVADEAGFTQQYISNIIRGLKPMTITAARSLSKVLHVREEYLLCEDDYRTDKDIWGKRKDLMQECENIVLDLLNVAGYTPICDFIKNWKSLNLDQIIYGPFEENDLIANHIPDEYDDLLESSTEILTPNGKTFYCDSEDIYLLTQEIIQYLHFRMSQLESKFAWRYDSGNITLKQPGSEVRFYESRMPEDATDLTSSSLWVTHEDDFFPNVNP